MLLSLALLVYTNTIVSLPLKDDPELFDYNVQERVNDFVAAAVAQVNYFACVACFYIFPIFEIRT